MNAPNPRFFFAAAAALLAACSSTPTRFYTLLPPAPPVTAAANADAAFRIELLPVDVPAQVDVPQFIVRDGAGVLVPVETRRWIAPLPAEIRGALIADLTQRLGVAEVGGVATDASAPRYRIQVSVRRFDSTLGGSAQIDALWSVQAARAGRDEAGATCESRVGVPVGSGYEALTEGHQKALAQIADAIARAVLAVRSNHAELACIDDAAAVPR